MLESRWQHAKNMFFFEENACFDPPGPGTRNEWTRSRNMHFLEENAFFHHPGVQAQNACCQIFLQISKAKAEHAKNIQKTCIFPRKRLVLAFWWFGPEVHVQNACHFLRKTRNRSCCSGGGGLQSVPAVL